MPQLKRPNDEPVERAPEPPKKVKKVKGPRALALLQTTSTGKTTLIPVAIVVEGKFHDASEYKADPVPMALESGTIYEVERTGSSEGLFTVNRALHSKAPGSPHPWMGDGSFLANGSQAADNTRKAEDVPRGFDNTEDAPPKLTRANGAAPAPGSAPQRATPSGSSDTKSQTSKPSDGSSAGPAPAATPPPSQPPSNNSPKTPAAPSGSSSSDTKQSSTGQNSPNGGQAQASAAKPTDQPPESSNYYRPTLRRGKPGGDAPPQEIDEPAPTKPVSQTSKTGATENAAAAETPPPQLVPAISDEGGPDPRSYKFFWKPGEEDERRTQMQELAANEVKAYLSALQKNRISAQPATVKKPAPRKSAAKPVQPEFENVRFQGFDVWSNNQPVMVFTAEAHMPAAGNSDVPPEIYNVTLVANTNIYGELHKLYSGVTDRFHLDVTPKLELIDVVDADGDGRGELLFNETTDAGSGYVLYRATADKLWKLFDSLGEGT
jgi:hypothetical protein